MPPVQGQQPPAAPAAIVPPAGTPNVVSPPQDLVSRIATAPAAKPAEPASEVTAASLEDIKDPTIRTVVETKLKNLESGFNKKYMKLAEEQKAAEALKQKYEQEVNQPWSPERLQQMLQRPDFAQAVQSAYQTQSQLAPPATWEGSQEQWSNLSDSDKQAFRHMQGQVNSLMSQQEQMQHAQEHERVKTRFPDYDPKAVESFYRDANAGKMGSEQIKEMIWKALNFQKYVDNAYAFGQQDRQGSLQEKINGNTNPQNNSVQVSGDMPQRADNESTRSFMSRLGNWNLSRQKQRAG